MQEIIEKNQNKLKKIFTQEGVVLAYLFGSQVRGTAGPLSDIDVAVLFSEEPQRCFERQISLALRIEEISGLKNVQIACLHEAPPLLKHRAVLSGKLLYSENPRIKTRMELGALQEYEDFKYHLAISNRAMRRHITNKTFGKAPLPSRNPHTF